MLVQVYQSHAPQGVGGGPERAGGGVAVAGGDRQVRAAGHGDAGVTYDLGKGAQAHDLGAHLFCHAGRSQQAAVGEFGPSGQHFTRRAADRDQPAFGFGTAGGDDVVHLAIHHRRHVRGQVFDAVHDELRRGLGDGKALADEVLAQRVNDEGKAADVAEGTGRVQQARLDVQFVEDFLEVVVGHFARRHFELGQDHGLQGVDADDFFKQLGRDIDH